MIRADVTNINPRFGRPRLWNRGVFKPSQRAHYCTENSFFSSGIVGVLRSSALQGPGRRRIITCSLLITIPRVSDCRRLRTPACFPLGVGGIFFFLVLCFNLEDERKSDFVAVICFLGFNVEDENKSLFRVICFLGFNVEDEYESSFSGDLQL